MATVYNKDGAKSFSHDGNSYEADENGHFEVPDEALADIAAHGFALVSSKPAAENEGEGGDLDKLHKPTDLAKLNKNELVAYAAEHLELVLDPEQKKADLIAQIEAHEAQAPEAADEQEGGDLDKLHKPTDLAKLNKNELVAYAAEHLELVLDPEQKKADLIAQIEAHEAQAPEAA